MASTESSSQSKRPGNTAFKQQRLKAWQPILTPKPVIISFLVIGIVFIPIGAGIVYSSNQVVEIDHRYDDVCSNSTFCTVSLEVKKDLEPPIYMYYRLENFYQNHRRYVKSRSDDQLKGNTVSSYTALTDCDPFISLGDKHGSEYLYNPCGLIAKSLFNDTLQLFTNSSEQVVMRKEGIAWSSDKKKKFKNPPLNAPGIRLIPDFEDEDFIVWMRTAGLPDFKKLYRVINNKLPAGTYYVNITNNFPVTSFGGKKHVVLSTTTWIGGRNPFLGYAYIVVGAICLILGVVFAIKHTIAPRKLGDTKYLEWNK